MFEEIDIKNSKIIIVDDSKSVRLKIKMMLTESFDNNLMIYEAGDGVEALNVIKKINPDLIILDIEMPGMNGIEVCKTVRDEYNMLLIPIVIITSSDSNENKTIALKSGANDFISKNLPNGMDIFDLKLKVESLLKIKHLTDQLEKADNIIISLAKTVEYKDYYTKGHADRVSKISKLIAKKLQLEPIMINDITLAGLLHDIGKIGVPDHILNKSDKLTGEEFEIIKKHPEIGEEICKPIKFFDKVREYIRHHHEKLNGKGYPDGLKGNQISLGARILSVADIFDAVTSRRAYRDSLSMKDAVSVLINCVAAGEIDENIVNILLKLIDAINLNSL